LSNRKNTATVNDKIPILIVVIKTMQPEKLDSAQEENDVFEDEHQECEKSLSL
jgi:hypothetical protein